MLKFCERCGNAMTLKEKYGREGLYECRGCGLVMTTRIEKLILTEQMIEEPPIGLVQKEFKFLG